MGRKNKNKAKDKFASSGGDYGWDSGLKVLKHVRVVVPWKLLTACKAIALGVEGNEFSVITNIDHVDENGKIFLEDTFFIPPQEVTSVSVEYGADERAGNVVIHRHPDGMNSFSGTDEEYINQNFLLSLLFTMKDDFVKGIYNVRTEDTDYIVQLPVAIEINIPDEFKNHPDMENIKTKTYGTKYNYRNERQSAGFNTYNDKDDYDKWDYKNRKSRNPQFDISDEDDEILADYYYDYHGIKDDDKEDDKKDIEKKLPGFTEVNNAIISKLDTDKEVKKLHEEAETIVEGIKKKIADREKKKLATVGKEKTTTASKTTKKQTKAKK